MIKIQKTNAKKIHLLKTHLHKIYNQSIDRKIQFYEHIYIFFSSYYQLYFKIVHYVGFKY